MPISIDVFILESEAVRIILESYYLKFALPSTAS